MLRSVVSLFLVPCLLLNQLASFPHSHCEPDCEELQAHIHLSINIASSHGHGNGHGHGHGNGHRHHGGVETGHAHSELETDCAETSSVPIDQDDCIRVPSLLAIVIEPSQLNVTTVQLHGWIQKAYRNEAILHDRSTQCPPYCSSPPLAADRPYYLRYHSLRI